MIPLGQDLGSSIGLYLGDMGVVSSMYRFLLLYCCCYIAVLETGSLYVPLFVMQLPM